VCVCVCVCACVRACARARFGMVWGLTFVIGPDSITPLSGPGNIHVRGSILIRILGINEITNEENGGSRIAFPYSDLDT
jgi:hypothetical protein